MIPRPEGGEGGMWFHRGGLRAPVTRPPAPRTGALSDNNAAGQALLLSDSLPEDDAFGQSFIEAGRINPGAPEF